MRSYQSLFVNWSCGDIQSVTTGFKAQTRGTVLCHYITSIALTCLLIYLINPSSRVLLEKLTGFQLVKKFPAFYGTRRFITTFTNVRHLSLSYARSIQPMPHPTSWRSILISASHISLGLPSGLFPSGFSKTLYAPLPCPMRASCPSHLILLELNRYMWFNSKTILNNIHL